MQTVTFRSSCARCVGAVRYTDVIYRKVGPFRGFWVSIYKPLNQKVTKQQYLKKKIFCQILNNLLADYNRSLFNLHDILRQILGFQNVLLLIDQWRC